MWPFKSRPKLSVTEHDDVVVLSSTGEWPTHEGLRLHELVAKHIEQGARLLVIDLSAASSMLGRHDLETLRAAAHTHRAGGKLAAVRPKEGTQAGEVWRQSPVGLLKIPEWNCDTIEEALEIVRQANKE